jgi:ribosomal protein S21
MMSTQPSWRDGPAVAVAGPDDLEHALRVFKRQCGAADLFRELRQRRFYRSPAQKRRAKGRRSRERRRKER